MSLLKMDYLEKIESYLASGDCHFDFEHGTEDARIEMLEYLEKFMEISDLADKIATELIFKKGTLEALAQVKLKE